MAKDPAHDLKSVATAVRRQKLDSEDIETLRAQIGELSELQTERRFVRAALRSLKVADTQLATIEARSKGAPFDEKAFEALPAHLRKRILARLDNIAKRMTDAAAQEEFNDPAFRCIRDYEICRSEARRSAIWCHIAMVVCVARTLLPTARAGGS